MQKRGGYRNQMTHSIWFCHSTDEQERVQKKTFVNWINSYLSKVSENLTFTFSVWCIKKTHVDWRLRWDMYLVSFFGKEDMFECYLATINPHASSWIIFQSKSRIQPVGPVPITIFQTVVKLLPFFFFYSSLVLFNDRLKCFRSAPFEMQCDQIKHTAFSTTVNKSKWAIWSLADLPRFFFSCRPTNMTEETKKPNFIWMIYSFSQILFREFLTIGLTFVAVESHVHSLVDYNLNLFSEFHRFEWTTWSKIWKMASDSSLSWRSWPTPNW